MRRGVVWPGPAADAGSCPPWNWSVTSGARRLYGAHVKSDSSGVEVILLARDWATAGDVELRMAVPPGPALAALKLAGLDELVPIYQALDEALAAGPAPDAGASCG